MEMFIISFRPFKEIILCLIDIRPLIRIQSKNVRFSKNHILDLLFISYKFVKGFLAMSFLLLLFLAETFMMCVKFF